MSTALHIELQQLATASARKVYRCPECRGYIGAHAQGCPEAIGEDEAREEAERQGEDLAFWRGVLFGLPLAVLLWTVIAMVVAVVLA